MAQLSDVALIYIVLVVLYLVESVPWIRPGCTAFSTFFGRFREPSKNRKIIGNESGYLGTFGLAPFDVTVVAEPCPVSVAVDGLIGFSAATAIGGDKPFCTEVACTWDEVKSLRRDERELWLKDRLFCRLGSIVTAKELLGHLQTIAAQNAEQREHGIDSFVASLFDTGYVKFRIEAWKLATQKLKTWSTFLFLWIFIIGGVRYHGLIPGFSGPGTLWGFLVALFIIWWTNNGFLFFAHQKLYPHAKGERWKTFFTTMVSPAASFRAADHLARNLVGLKHPLAVAAILCSKEELTDLTTSVLRDLRYPKSPEFPGTGDESKAIVTSFQHSIERAIARFSAKYELVYDDIDLAPTPVEAGSSCYCPRCLQEFSVTDAQCTTCGNRTTVPFKISQDSVVSNE